MSAIPPIPLENISRASEGSYFPNKQEKRRSVTRFLGHQISSLFSSQSDSTRLKINCLYERLSMDNEGEMRFDDEWRQPLIRSFRSRSSGSTLLFSRSKEHPGQRLVELTSDLNLNGSRRWTKFDFESLLAEQGEASHVPMTQFNDAETIPFTTISFSSKKEERPPQTPEEGQLWNAQALIPYLLAPSPNELRKMILLYHFWFTPTPCFLKAICQKVVEDPAHYSSLWSVALELLRRFPLDIIPQEVLFDIFRILPKTKNFEEKREAFKAVAWPFLNTRSQTSTSLSEPTFTKLRLKTPRGCTEINSAIETHKKSKAWRPIIQELALDLKKLETHLFSQIQRSDFALYKPDAQSAKAPHIKACIHHTNMLIYFVASHILSYQDPDIRARCCKFYIRLMKRSIRIHNFNSAFALLGALNTSSITRLKRTWEKVGARHILRLKKIDELFSDKGNFSHYRQHLKELRLSNKKRTAERCIIPLFGSYLTSFTLIAQGNPTHLPDGRLSLQKMALFAEQHASLEGYQEILSAFQSTDLFVENSTYDLRHCLEMASQQVTKNFINIDNALDFLYGVSKKREPPQPQPHIL